MDPTGTVSPLLCDGHDVGRTMRRVLYALSPATIVMFWLLGWGVLINLALAGFVALVVEAASMSLRGRAVAPTLADGSALVTAWLLALSLPPMAPWWLVTIAVFVAMGLGKHVYGGLGFNPFNPAMVGYAVVLVSFPLEMITWPVPSAPGAWPSLADSLAVVAGGGGAVDGFSGATPLDLLRTRLIEGIPVEAVLAEPVYGHLAGAGWEWVSAGFLVGGLWLIYTGTADWRIPVSMLGALALGAWLLNLADPLRFAPAGFHLFAGAAMIGAFFIATDPVSACTTPLGRWLFGAGVGTLTLLIRSFGGFPDGVAFAVLLMNLAAPTIDHFARWPSPGGRR